MRRVAAWACIAACAPLSASAGAADAAAAGNGFGAAAPGLRPQDAATPAAPTASAGDDLRFVAAIRFNGAALPDYHDVAVGADGTLFLPAEEIFRAGEATVTVEDGRLTLAQAAAGRSLVLDHARGTLETETGRRPLRAADYRFTDGILLVSERLLAEAFELEAQFRPVTQELVVKSARPFPRDLRLARERRWDRLDAADPAAAPAAARTPDYTPFGSPQADVTLGWQHGGSGTTAGWNALVVSEALWLTHHLYAGGSLDAPLDGLRLRTGRMAADGGVFGVAPLHDAQFGDVSGARMPLVGGGGSGRGIRLQAAPPGRATNFDSTLVEGDAMPGWDAELYLGTRLVDFQRIGPDGRYRFDGIALDYGVNELKVVLYGPQGQVREEVFRQQIGSGMVPPGEVYGTAYAIQDDVSLFRRRGTGQASHGPWVGGARADVGVSQRLTVGLFAARARNTAASAAGDMVDDYYGVEVRPALGSVGLEAGAARRARGGAAAYARVALPIHTTSLSATWQHYGPQYASNDNEGGRLADRAALRFGIPLGVTGAALGAVGIGIEAFRRWSGERERRLMLSWGHRLGPLFLGHQAESRSIGGSAAPRSSGQYTLRASYRHALFDWRAEMRHGLGTAAGLQAVTLTGLWRRDDSNRLFMTISHAPGGGTVHGVGWSRDLGVAALSLSASAGGGEYALGLGLSFSFGHTPGRGVTFSSRPRATMGLLDLFLFEDVDADGAFTAGRDKAIPNAGVLLDRRPLAEGSGADGRIGLHSLSIHDPLEIAIDKGSLPDGFLVPLQPVQRTWLRPGRAMEVGIPVTESGEISGVATIALAAGASVLGGNGKNGNGRAGNRNGSNGSAAQPVEHPLPGIRIQVLDARGRLHAEVRSFSDGYFVFDTVYPGRWTVRVAPDQRYRDIRLMPASSDVELTPRSRAANGLRFAYSSDGRP